jgi:hypothetical protein
MRIRAITAGLLLLAVALAAACGDNRSAARKAMDARFREIDYRMSTLETTASAYNHTYLEKATQQYILLVRRYADLLGRKEVKRRLQEKGDEIAPYCLPCTALLDDETRRH